MTTATSTATLTLRAQAVRVINAAQYRNRRGFTHSCRDGWWPMRRKSQALVTGRVV